MPGRHVARAYTEADLTYHFTEKRESRLPRTRSTYRRKQTPDQSIKRLDYPAKCLLQTLWGEPGVGRFWDWSAELPEVGTTKKRAQTGGFNIASRAVYFHANALDSFVATED